MTVRLLLFLVIGLVVATTVRAYIVPVPSPYVMVDNASFIGEGRLSPAGNRWEFTVDYVIKGLARAGDRLEVIDPAPSHAATLTYIAKTLEGQPVILFGDLVDGRVSATYGTAGIWPDGLYRKTFPADTIDQARNFIEALRSYQELVKEPQALIDRLMKDATTDRRYSAIEFADQAIVQLQEIRDAGIGNEIVTAIMTVAWRSNPDDPYLDEKFLQLSPKISPSIALQELARIADQPGRRADLAKQRLERSLRIRQMIQGKGWTISALKRALEQNKDFLRRVDGERALKLLNNSIPAVRAAGERVLERVFEREIHTQTQAPTVPSKTDMETWRKHLEPLRRFGRKTLTTDEAK